MKRSLALVMIIVMILAATSVAYAASSRRGKKVFARVCEACHVEKSDAGAIKPSDKTRSQWQRYIQKNRHRADTQVLDSLSNKDKENLLEFLHDYAADADVAETCG